MYTQEIICPYCGVMTIVNVGDTEGNTKTPCQKCKRKIVVETNKDGKVVTVRQEYCFLTSACIQAAGLPDNCNELQTLRKFRDEYVLRLPNGGVILSKYYTDSQQIIKAISNTSTSTEVYNAIWAVIRSVVCQIEAGNNAKALSLYMSLVDNLVRKYVNRP